MSFLQHLEELRIRLVRAMVSLVVGFGVCWAFSERIFHFITGPLRVAYPTVQFIATSPTETFMLFIKMSFFVGIFVVSPYVLWQIWAFIAPGLYQHERKYAWPFIGFGALFFILGGAFGHYILFPMTFSYLATVAKNDVTFMPKVSEYFTFYSWFLLGIGAVFQLPVIIFVLARIGFVTAGFLLRQSKYAVLGAFVLSAVITPSGDVVTQTALAVPIIGLYFLGVLVAWLFGKPRRAAAASEPEAPR